MFKNIFFIFIVMSLVSHGNFIKGAEEEVESKPEAHYSRIVYSSYFHAMIFANLALKYSDWDCKKIIRYHRHASYYSSSIVYVKKSDSLDIPYNDLISNHVVFPLVDCGMGHAIKKVDEKYPELSDFYSRMPKICQGALKRNGQLVASAAVTRGVIGY